MSPKGDLRWFRILGPREVGYLDFIGSGAWLWSSAGARSQAPEAAPGRAPLKKLVEAQHRGGADGCSIVRSHPVTGTPRSGRDGFVTVTVTVNELLGDTATSCYTA